MKKNLLIALVILIAIGVSVSAQDTPREATIKKTDVAPTIDGNLDDAVWTVVDEFAQDHIIWIKDADGNQIDLEGKSAASPFTWKACWDADFLYVSISSEDATITRDSPGIMVEANDDGFDVPIGFVSEDETANENCVMISINVEEDENAPIWTSDKCCGFKANYDLAIENGAEFANTVSDAGWNVEFKYPFAALDVTIEDGTFMRFSPKYNDDNGNLAFDPEEPDNNKIGSQREEHTSWGAINGSWTDPSTWGAVTYSTEVLEVPQVAVNNAKVKAFGLYPNPANEVIAITNAELGSNVSVLNMVGQEVLTSVVNDVNVELNIANLISGIYFVKVGDATQKIIVE